MIGSEDVTVGELGEAGVLARVLRNLGPAAAASVGPGDDCAVLAYVGESVVTTDTMIEGPDFRLAWHSGFELGWKLAATNLSDVAAMGAVPVGLTVAFAVPRDLPVCYLEEVARGLTAACAELAPGCGVVGGDLGRAPVLMAAVTAFGDLGPQTPVLRSGARVGDVVAYAGQLGLAGQGLAQLFAGATEADGTAHSRTLGELRSAHPAAIAAQFAPMPPIALGVVAAQAGATAMMDVSDGLALDASRIAAASGVTVALHADLLRAGFGEQAGEAVSVPAMLFGGEDHGLLATFPADVTLPTGFVRIGETVTREGDELGTHQAGLSVTTPGVLLDGAPVSPAGWDPYLVVPPGSN